MEKAAYKRIMLKLSGEALAGPNGTGIDFDTLDHVTDEIAQVAALGIQIAVVVGAGNFWRGRSGGKMDRTTADHMGMLATVMNALAIQDSLEQKGIQARVETAIQMTQIAEPYIRRKAVHDLEVGRVVIFGCGTGNPFFTTDMAAALRAVEIGAEAILLAKNVDGVYDSDPRKNPDAKKFEHIGYMEVLERGLTVMDTTAITLCMDNKIPILVFGLAEKNSIMRTVKGEKLGTVIGNSDK